MQRPPLISSFVIALALAISCYSAKGQTSPGESFKKVKALYQTKSLGCDTVPRQCQLYFRKKEKALDIIDVWIPLAKVSIRYRYFESKGGGRHFVDFTCTGSNLCMYNGNPPFNDKGKTFMVPFRAKEDCEEFIASLVELKTSLGINQ